MVGDSLSAAYGISQNAGWVNLLSERLKNSNYRITNASVSGETSQGGEQRLAALLTREQPHIVIIELGANDGLRGIDPSETQTHLGHMIEMCQKAHARILLIGIDLPANYGNEYRQSFRGTYTALKNKYRLPLLDNLLKAVPLREDNFQSDHLHPIAEVQPLIETSVYATLKPLLASNSP